MAADDVARGLMGMDDDGLRAAVANGDFAGLAHLELSDAERALLQDAAGDDAEVEGFLFGNGLGLMQCSELPGAKLGAAVGYAGKGLSPGLANSFNQWSLTKNAQGGW